MQKQLDKIYYSLLNAKQAIASDKPHKKPETHQGAIEAFEHLEEATRLTTRLLIRVNRHNKCENAKATRARKRNEAER